MAGNIGIKEANGDFYSILEENSAVKKRLVLTTVHDKQKSVQIDLYKSLAKSMADAVYIGSIVVENISPKPKGEPSIEMVLSSSRDGSITANAVDLGNPSNEHHLSVSLKSLEDDKNEYPDFEMDSKEPEKQRRKFPILAVLLIGLILALICLGLWFFLLRSRPAGSEQAQTQAKPVQEAPAAPQAPQVDQKAAPQAQTTPAPPPASQAPAAQTPAAQTPEPAAKPAPQPVVVEAPPRANPQAAGRQRSAAPVYSYNVPQTIPTEGIAYRVRSGDTLWDISEAFYRNPRLYSYIGRSNGIRNPNIIVSGTELVILPRN